MEKQNQVLIFASIAVPLFRSNKYACFTISRDEYLSSEPEGMSEISGTSSASHFTNCDNRNLGIYVSASPAQTEGSDLSFIEFRNPGSDSSIAKEIPSTAAEEVQHQQTLTSINEPEKAEQKRRKSAKTSRVYLYIQMQLCQKNSLREWLRDNLERDQNTVLNMFDQIVQAVEYVHLQGLIHRDLKVSLNDDQL